MNNIELCHLGDNCLTGVIIDEILNIHKKYLFMIGMYNFNDIINYLNDNNYENIYNKQNLIIMGNGYVHHNLYKFTFNHDYIIKDGLISNYDNIKERFDIKIKNFREMLISNNKCIFITFTKSIDLINIEDMLKWLSYNKKDYHLIIFTEKLYYSTISSDKLTIIKLIKLENQFSNWWKNDKKDNIGLYKEIYDKFIDCLTKSNIINNFPKTFEETNYEKKINKMYENV